MKQFRIINFNNAATRRNFDFFSLAPTPHEETCTPAGESPENQVKECTALINQMIREIGKEPEDAEFFIIANTSHEFGIYYEVGIFYKEQTEKQEEDDEETPGMIYAQKAESSIPYRWDETAKQELREAGHPAYQAAKIIKMKAA